VIGHMDEISNRYERQVLLSEIGEKGQDKLAVSSVLVVGAGGLGAPVLQYLAAAGVGRIGIADGDTVSISNLNRQILYGEEDIGKPKAEHAAKRIKQLNSGIEVTWISKMVTDENAREIISSCDAAALCTDSLLARKILNRACVAAGTPFVDGAVNRFHGTVMTIVPGETPCYECIHGASSQPRETIPILGAMAGWIGCAETLAVIRLLLGVSDASRGNILFFNGTEMTVEHIPLLKNPDCICCRHTAL